MADNGGSQRQTAGTGNRYPWSSNSFDYVNWYYWSIWWQQYWLCQAAQLYGSPGMPVANDLSGSPLPAMSPNTASANGGQEDQAINAQQQQQWAQYVQQMARTTYPPQPRNANAPERQRRPELLLRINLLRGGYLSWG